MASFDYLAKDIADLSKMHHARPLMVGIAGAPAVGKTTLANKLEGALCEIGFSAVALQMDGFHYCNRHLRKCGLESVKGRIDTFDIDSLKDLLKKLKTGHSKYWWPIYSRDLHDPVKKGRWIGEIPDIAIVEGNYLFINLDNWQEIGPLFDIRIFLDASNDVISQRLIQRHTAGGKTYAQALEKVRVTDLSNAEFIRSFSAGPFIQYR